MVLVAAAFPHHRSGMTPRLPPKPPAMTKPAWLRAIAWVAMIGVIAFVLHSFLGWSQNFVGEMNSISATMTMTGLIVLSLVIYALLIATPFMPGIEVGIALLLLQGSAIAPFVYLATVGGLLTAYLIGHYVPLAWLRKVFCDLGLQRVCALLDTIDETPVTQRLAAHKAHLPRWMSRLTVEYRYVTLGLLLNIPGTFAIGGGGGIVMAAGLSRLFSIWSVIVTLMIATLPVPLTVWLVGVSVFDG